jgi:protein-S-isoprenylcysteine O-methyltransferase Ste14
MMNGRNHNHGAPANAPIYPFPPVMVAAFIAAGWALNRLLPLTGAEPVPDVARIAGGLIVVCAIGLASAGFLELHRTNTTFRPGHPASALARGSVFRFSRNPIYLSFAIFTSGLGIATFNPWMILAALGVLLYLQECVVKREETYLTLRFGADYLAYVARVRRWF